MNPFDNISENNKRKLLRLLEADEFIFKKNSEIFKSINQDKMIGILIDGYAQIQRINYNGTKIITEEIYPGDVFGSEISYATSEEYNIIAKEDSKIIFINYNDLISFEDYNKAYYNQFLKNLYLIITKKINERNERIQILTRKTIRDKLLEYFNITSKKNKSKIIYLPFNFIDLADYLSVDRSAMSRELSYLKEEGFIKTKGKRITLLY